MAKRTLSNAGSPPPPSTSTTTTKEPKAKKPKPSTSTKGPKPPKKPKKGTTAVSSSGGGGVETPMAMAAGSPPPPLGPGTPGGNSSSWFASSPPPFGGAMSPPRGRSVSVLDAGGAELGMSMTTATTGGKKGKGKGKSSQQQQQQQTLEENNQDDALEKEQEEREEQDAEDEDELDFSDDEYGSNAQEIAKQKEDLRVLLEHFDEEQMSRYEHYRRSGLNKASVRKLVNQLVGQTVSPSILTVVRGFAKVFVGEIVEKARATNPHPGPLTPQDLKDAYRLYLEEHQGAGAGGQGGGRKKMFVR